jgi:hypothetical protein
MCVCVCVCVCGEGGGVGDIPSSILNVSISSGEWLLPPTLMLLPKEPEAVWFCEPVWSLLRRSKPLPYLESNQDSSKNWPVALYAHR